MKQNLLFNQASALGKRLAMVLTMLLIVGIGQAWGADEWTLVKNVSDLVVGDEVVIAANGSNYALGTTQNTNNRNAVAITQKMTTSHGQDIQFKFSLLKMGRLMVHSLSILVVVIYMQHHQTTTT